MQFDVLEKDSSEIEFQIKNLESLINSGKLDPNSYQWNTASYLQTLKQILDFRQQLAQREAEVAGLVEVVNNLRPKHSILCPENNLDGPCECDARDINAWIEPRVGSTQATAEAHDAKVREQAIRECMDKMKGFWENPDAEHPYLELEALLNKPESEGV